jgi:hypothetical protein
LKCNENSGRKFIGFLTFSFPAQVIYLHGVVELDCSNLIK